MGQSTGLVRFRAGPPEGSIMIPGAGRGSARQAWPTPVMHGIMIPGMILRIRFIHGPCLGGETRPAPAPSSAHDRFRASPCRPPCNRCTLCFLVSLS